MQKDDILVHCRRMTLEQQVAILEMRMGEIKLESVSWQADSYTEVEMMNRNNKIRLFDSKV